MQNVKSRLDQLGAWHEVEIFPKELATIEIKALCGGDSRTIQKHESGLIELWQQER